MNKKELTQAIATKSGLNLKNSELALNAVIQSIEEALMSGDSVKLVGFGTFGTRPAAARTGRNVSTGEVINIPAKTKAFCKMSSVLKKAINDVQE